MEIRAECRHRVRWIDSNRTVAEWKSCADVKPFARDRIQIEPLRNGNEQLPVPCARAGRFKSNRCGMEMTSSAKASAKQSDSNRTVAEWKSRWSPLTKGKTFIIQIEPLRNGNGVQRSCATARSLAHGGGRILK